MGNSTVSDVTITLLTSQLNHNYRVSKNVNRIFFHNLGQLQQTFINFGTQYITNQIGMRFIRVCGFKKIVVSQLVGILWHFQHK